MTTELEVTFKVQIPPSAATYEQEVSEGDCMSGASSQHTCVGCGKEFTFRAGT